MAKQNVKISVPQLIKFFDVKDKESKSHATAIVSMAGEDLAAGIFKHFLQNVKKVKGVNILDERPKTGKKKGFRLDRWIEVSQNRNRCILYQTEIKNWSAHAFGGKNISIKASENELREYCAERWEVYGKQFRKEAISGDKNFINKVLANMKLPENYEPSNKVLPLLIFWSPVCKARKLNCYSSIKLEQPLNATFPINSNFTRVYIFSISLYLRLNVLGKSKSISVEMPDFSSRFSLLKNIFTLD